MTTMSIDILNNDALRLLRDMEFTAYPHADRNGRKPQKPAKFIETICRRPASFQRTI